MIKTETEIRRDFIALLENSALGKEIRGGVYPSEMRPLESRNEDLIVMFNNGMDEQTQSGIVLLHLYVPDVTHNDNGKLRKVEAKTRIGELEKLILQFIEEPGTAEYALSSETTPRSYPSESIEQHFICAKIKFKRITL